MGNVYELQLSFRLHFHANFLGFSSVSIKEVIFNIFVILEVPRFFPMPFTLFFLAHSQLGAEHLAFSEHFAFAIFFAVHISAIKMPLIHKLVSEEPVPETLLQSHK